LTAVYHDAKSEDLSTITHGTSPEAQSRQVKALTKLNFNPGSFSITIRGPLATCVPVNGFVAAKRAVQATIAPVAADRETDRTINNNRNNTGKALLHIIHHLS
jgi:hypothetical protein